MELTLESINAKSRSNLWHVARPLKAAFLACIPMMAYRLGHYPENGFWFWLMMMISFIAYIIFFFSDKQVKE